MNKVWVISLGGSRIVPDEVDFNFLREFKKIVDKHPGHRFVIVTGGGSIARKYIQALRHLKKTEKNQSMLGIAVTRLNALLMTKVFGKEANDKLPEDMKDVKNMLKKNKVVFCGALRWKAKNTSDGTSADIAGFLKAPFINITNTKGIYNKNPKTNKNARFIKHVSWRNFYERTHKMKFKAGQHFVLDQKASEIIMKKRIPTYIIGDLKDIDRILAGKNYQGSLISG